MNPISFNGSNLYFRGSVNMRASFKWADLKFNLSRADRIVLAGSGAGGVGAFLWIDYLKGLVSNKSKVYGIADTAIYMDPVEMARFYDNIAPIIYYTFPSNKSQSMLKTMGENVIEKASMVDQLYRIVNANEPPPNTKCVDSLKQG